MNLHPIQPHLLRSKIFYVLFLGVTFLLTALLYFFARQRSLAVALFVVVNVGQAHYLMAYGPTLRKLFLLPRAQCAQRITLWLAAGALYFVIFYTSGLPFAWAIFSILIITSFHFARDYAFFYHAFRSSFSAPRRPRLPTIFLGTAYISFLFLLFYYFPYKVGQLYLDPLPPLLFGILGAVGLAGALVSGYRLLPDNILSTAKRAFAHAFLFAVPAVGASISNFFYDIDPLDYVYLIVLWHFVLWLAFTSIKILSSTTTKSGATGATRHIPDKQALRFFAHAILVHTLIFSAALFFFRSGGWSSFSAFADKSFLWGLYGYPFWSFLHIVLTSFPAPAKKVAVSI